MKRAWITFFFVVAGCSYTFDTQAPELPLVGNAPDTPSLPHLNSAPADGEVFALGADQRVFLIMHQVDNSWRMVPMSGDTSTVETLSSDDADDLFVAWRALYITKRLKPSDLADGGIAVDPSSPPDMGTAPPLKLTVRSIGERPGHTFLLPSGPGVLFSGGSDDVFAYLVTDSAQPGYILQRRDESFKRVVPWPKGIDGANPFAKGVFFFDSGAGELFFDRDADGRLVAHHTRDNLDVDLGIRPRFLSWLDSRTLITCGVDGVRVVPVDGVTPERVLDNDQCKTQLLWLNRGYVYYDVGTAVRKTKLDGSAPPQTLFEFGTSRVMVITPTDKTILYSTDPSDRYVHGAGDGWLGNWRFMDRGTGVTVANDLQIHWLEHSAQGTGAGQLMSVTLPAPGVPGGTPVTLTRNTRQYGFLDDGRIICDENHAYGGIENRIVLVDETRRHKQWVATSASHFSQVPSSRDFIVDVISGATGHDVVRVKLPPIDPPPPPNK